MERAFCKEIVLFVAQKRCFETSASKSAFSNGLLHRVEWNIGKRPVGQGSLPDISRHRSVYLAM